MAKNQTKQIKLPYTCSQFLFWTEHWIPWFQPWHSLEIRYSMALSWGDPPCVYQWVILSKGQCVTLLPTPHLASPRGSWMANICCEAKHLSFSHYPWKLGMVNIYYKTEYLFPCLCPWKHGIWHVDHKKVNENLLVLTFSQPAFWNFWSPFPTCFPSCPWSQLKISCPVYEINPS